MFQEPPDVDRGDAIGHELFNLVKHAAFRKFMGANIRSGPEGFTAIPENANDMVYIAKVISGMTAMTPGSPDQPGTGECTIYRIEVVSGTPKLVAASQTLQTVYNLSPIAIDDNDADPYVLVQPTAFGNWVVVPQGVPFCYGWASSGAGQTVTPAGTGGGTLVSVGINGIHPGLLAGNGTTGSFKVTLPGSYLIVGGVCVEPSAGDISGLATPPINNFSAVLSQNGSPLLCEMFSHFHCITDPNNTTLAWKGNIASLVIPSTGVDMSFPANTFGSGIPSGTTNVSTGSTSSQTISSISVSLPNLPSADGSVSTSAIVTLAANDQIGLYLKPSVEVEVLDAYLAMFLLAQTPN
jgi:hypothetical protein